MSKWSAAITNEKGSCSTSPSTKIIPFHNLEQMIPTGWEEFKKMSIKEEVPTKVQSKE